MVRGVESGRSRGRGESDSLNVASVVPSCFCLLLCRVSPFVRLSAAVRPRCPAPVSGSGGWRVVL